MRPGLSLTMRRLFRVAAILLIAAVPVAIACAAPDRAGIIPEEPAPERTHVVTLEDYFGLGYATSVSASPNGGDALYLLGRWDEALDRRNRDIWIVGGDRAPRQLTWSKASEGGLSWHPGGREFFFVRPHDKKSQVWRMAIDGGEARPVTSAKEGVGAYRVTRDGKSLVYTSREKATIGEWDWFKKKYGKLQYGSGIWRLGRLWRQDLEGDGKPEKLLEGEYNIGSFDVSPDGRRIAFVKTPDPRLIRLEGWSEVMIYDVASKALVKIPDRPWREEAKSPYGWIEGPRWSPDGTAVAFTVSWDGYPTEIYVARLPREGEVEVTRVARPDGPEVAGGTLQWGGSGALYFRVQDRTRGRVYKAIPPATGGHGPGSVARAVTPGTGHVSTFSVAADESKAYVIRTLPDRNQDVCTVPLAEAGRSPPEPARLTDIDPHVASWILPETRVVTWKGWNGDEVEGVLDLPAGYDGKSPLPTVVMLHGGPGSASLSVFNYWLSEPVPLYAAEGWAVFRPNYRGSIGYGDKFHTELIGHKNDRDVADINAGVDWLIEEGIADPDRLAVGGWSNGGSLTNWLVVSSPDRFKAAASGAGVADFILQFGLEDTPGHVVNYSEGFPWDVWETLMKRSALAQANRVKTPVLFLVGQNDARVPAAHARSFHRSLTYLGVPTELIVFPGEGHGLSKMKHRRAKIEMEHAWFEKYVLGKDPTPPPKEEPVEEPPPKSEP